MINLDENIRGAGGGKGGGGGRAAVEDPNTLRSRQYANLVDLLCEGEIKGLVNGLQSVYLNDTPIQNPNGSMNFNTVSYYASNGGPVLSTKLGRPGYFTSGGIKVTNAVSVELRHGAPTVRTITNPEADWAEITIGIPQLSKQNKENGDISGHNVTVGIEIQSNGGGFAQQVLSTRWIEDSTAIATGHHRTNSGSVTGLAVDINVIAATVTGLRVEYRRIDQQSWTEITNPTRTGAWFRATLRYEVSGLSPAQYEVRMTGDPGTSAAAIGKVSVLRGVWFDIIAGKCMSRYQRTYKIPLVGSAPWDIRVTRLSIDAPDSSISDKTYWDSLTERVDVKMSYANSAAVMMTMDAEGFQSVPTRGYLIDGLIVRVPTNYDPETRTFTGAWNGAFKLAWTDDPAWCFYDLITNTRYGLGDLIDPNQVDKWALYEISRYCNQMVPDGFGGMEPRFTCNLYLQTREDAFKVVGSMASIFRGMAFWANGQIMATQDSPKDPVALFTAANVLEGMFTYQGADRRARHTVALVTWNDPNDQYRQKIEYVQDDDAVLRWGVVESQILAVGCTSRGQAHRVGKWLLFTEQNESETVNFRAGMDAARVAPGDVISIQDSVRSGKRNGGRLQGATLTTLNLDAPVTLEAGHSYQVSVVLPSGAIETREVGNGVGETQVLTVTAPFAAVPVDQAIWVMTASNLVPEQWRVLTISETNEGHVDISAVYHHPGKYAAVEQDIALDYIPTSSIQTRPGQVTNIVSLTELFTVNEGTMSTRISIDWKAPATAATYSIAWRRDDGNYKSDTSDVPSFEIENVAAGTYTIKIVARNALGLAGPEVVFEHIVESSGVSPDVQNLRLNPDFLGRDLPLKWDAVPGSTEYEIEVRDPANPSVLIRQESTPLTEWTYPYAKNAQDGGPRRSVRISVRAKTLIGTSANWTSDTFSNPAPAMPSGIEVSSGPGQVSVLALRPADQDLAGMIVWMGVTPDFEPTNGNRIYRGSDNAFTKTGLEPAIPKYFRVAFFDGFGEAGMNISPSLMSTPGSLGGVMQVTTLPANPGDIGGELAIFLNVEDAGQRGLYGWDGTQWVNTKGLFDGSVTSAKLAIAAVQARNLAIRKHFIY